VSARAARKRWLAVGAVGLLAVAGCGDGDDTAGPAKDPFRALPEGTITARADRSAPRWEPLAIFAGSGPLTRTVDISPRAIQWRARWQCKETLSITVSPAPRSGSARAEARCPTAGEHAWVASGRRALRVQASGRWRLTVEQEVDTPLREPPLAAMRSPAAKVLARGDFYKIERKGGGSATLYRLGNGRLALRMAGFATDPNTDLFVWLSEAAHPLTTKTAFRTRHVEFAALKSTLGDQNYLLPRSADAARIRSIVIWCEPVQIAYTAAALRR
jgi:hypothetical protein